MESSKPHIKLRTCQTFAVEEVKNSPKTWLLYVCYMWVNQKFRFPYVEVTNPSSTQSNFSTLCLTFTPPKIYWVSAGQNVKSSLPGALSVSTAAQSGLLFKNRRGHRHGRPHKLLAWSLTRNKSQLQAALKGHMARLYGWALGMFIKNINSDGRLPSQIPLKDVISCKFN
jgi:hypothetical protein